MFLLFFFCVLLPLILVFGNSDKKKKQAQYQYIRPLRRNEKRYQKKGWF